MPYVIETYKRYKKNAPLSLVGIDTDQTYDTLEGANKAIQQLYIEQDEDNETLLEWYREKLEASVLDLVTDDRIPREPTLYDYIYQAKFYPYDQVAAIY